VTNFVAVNQNQTRGDILIYTAIFAQEDGRYAYNLFDAPNGFNAAWSAIEREVNKQEIAMSLVAIVPGNQQIGFRDNFVNGPSPFQQPRAPKAWVAR